MANPDLNPPPAALIKENWDDSVGALYDGGPCTTNGTGKCAVHAQDGNGLAILSGATDNSYAAGLVGPGTTPAASILAFCTAALSRPYGNAFYDRSTLSPSDQFDQRVYAFVSYFELAARFRTSQNALNASIGDTNNDNSNNNNNNATLGGGGDPSAARAAAAGAFEELRRLYGHMASNDPFSTFWEGIGPGGGYYEEGYTSLAHGWSTGVVPLLQKYVLGVTPTGPGFATFDVRPVTVGGGLGWARGVVPTSGSGGEGIGVDWTVADTDSGRGLTLTVTAPAASVGTVYVPVAEGDDAVARDGTTVWTAAGGVQTGVASGDEVRVQGRYVVVGVEAGSTHVFTTSA